MGELSLTHWLIVAVIFLIFFKKDQLPSLGRSIGQSIRGFKEALNEIEVPAKDIKEEKKHIAENVQAEQKPAEQKQKEHQNS